MDLEELILEVGMWVEDCICGDGADPDGFEFDGDRGYVIIKMAEL